MASLLVFTVVTGGVAAAASWDTETTNTATTSDVSGASTTLTFDRGNASKSIYFEVDGAASSNVTLKMTPANTKLDTVVYENSTADVTDSANGHYAFSVSHAELEDLPTTANKGTFNVSIYVDGAVAVSGELVLDQSAKTEQTVVMWVTDNSGTDAATTTDLVADTLSTETESNLLLPDEEMTSYSSFTQIDGTNSTTKVYLKNDTVRTQMDNETQGLSSGDLIMSQQLYVNSGPVLMYADAAPSDVANNTTYATYDSSNGVVTIHHGDGLSSVDQLHMSATAGEGYPFQVAQSNFGWGLAADLSWDWIKGMSPMTTVPAGLVG
jgi:hypothetical protein